MNVLIENIEILPKLIMSEMKGFQLFITVSYKSINHESNKPKYSYNHQFKAFK